MVVLIMVVCLWCVPISTALTAALIGVSNFFELAVVDTF